MKRPVMSATIVTIILLATPIVAAAPGGVAGLDRNVGDAIGDGWPGLGAYDSVAEWIDAGGDVMPPGAPGAGLPERLAANPDDIGLGAVVLDSRYMHHTTHIDPAYFTGLALARNAITPGLGMFFAWYGAWTDLDRDGVIDDYSEENLRNEFDWHEAEGPMVAWVWPSNPDVGCRPPAGYGLNRCRDNPLTLQNEAGFRSLGALERNANRGDAPSFEYSRSASGYRAGIGQPTTFLDDGFIMTTWVMTVSNAAFQTGAGGAFYDYTRVEKPDQLRDVDRYDSVDPFVESLYLASVNAARALPSELVAEAGRTANEILVPLVALVNEVAEPLDGELEKMEDLRDEVLAAAAGIVDEANAARDQALEEYNRARGARSLVYPGIAEGVVEEGCAVRDSWCPFVRLNLASMIGTPVVSAQVTPQKWVSPGTQSGGDRSNVPSYVMGDIVSGWWKDVNGDGWVGAVCDPQDPEQWDGESAKCRNPYDFGWSHAASDYHDESEFAPACFFWRLTDHVYVKPDGAWPPGSLLVRNFRGMVVPNYVPLVGDAVADLRIRDASRGYCGLGEPGAMNTEDALLLPAGSHLGDLIASLEKDFPGWHDAGVGVEYGGGYVKIEVRTTTGLL